MTFPFKPRCKKQTVFFLFECGFVLSSSAVCARQGFSGRRTQSIDPNGRPAVVCGTCEHRTLTWHVSTPRTWTLIPEKKKSACKKQQINYCTPFFSSYVCCLLQLLMLEEKQTTIIYLESHMHTDTNTQDFSLHISEIITFLIGESWIITVDWNH